MNPCGAFHEPPPPSPHGETVKNKGRGCDHGKHFLQRRRQAVSCLQKTLHRTSEAKEKVGQLLGVPPFLKRRNLVPRPPHWRGEAVKVHMKRKTSFLFADTQCGWESADFYRVTNRWRKVTCKNCLKCKRAPSKEKP